MADLILNRLQHDDFATVGALFLGDERLCFTLENRPPRIPGVKEPGKSRIPAGTHGLSLRGVGGFYTRYTNRWPWHREMVEIDVVDPDASWRYVLFHVGNFARNTKGCVLLGETRGVSEDDQLMVGRSRVAYRKHYATLLEAAKSGARLIITDET